MSHQSNSSPNEPPLANDLVEQSPKNFLDIVKFAANPYVKLSIFLSLGVIIHLPSFNRAVQAKNSTHSSSIENQGDRRSQTKTSRTPLLPRILNFAAFSAKSQVASLNNVANSTVSSSLSLKTKSAGLNSVNYSQKFNLAKTTAETIAKTIAKTTVKPPQIYQVQQGDTISKIAQRYQVSNDDIVSINQISNSNIIFVNQRLKIPVSQVLADNIKSQDKSTANTYDRLDQRQKAAASTVNQKVNSAKLEQDPYITKLRAEIDSLRAQNPAKSAINDVPVSLSAKQNSEAEYQSKTNQLNSPESKVKSNSPLPKLSFGSNLLEEETVALRLPLPPLPDSNEYLPSAFDGYIWPAQGVLTSGYGWRWGRLHSGIDIAAPIGTPIFAAAAGKVVGAGWHSGYGNVVKLEHLDGSFTLYAHTSKILVEPGQQVNQGEEIAEIGSTGNSTGPHLHFEIHPKGDIATDPLAFLDHK